MSPRSATRFAAAAFLALLALPTLAFATTNFWPRTAATSTHLGFGVYGMESSMDAVPDEAGGFFVTQDDGSYTHVQHVLANGSTAWPWYTYQLPGTTNGYGNPAIVLDHEGGVLVAYETHGLGGDDLKVMRVTAAGAPAAGWPTGGRSVCPSSDYDYLADITTDGVGGMFVAFIRSGAYRVHVQHLLSDGKADPNWPENGVAIQEGGNCYSAPQVFEDGEGGAMIFYAGNPTGPNALLVSRIGANGVKRTDLFPGSGFAFANGTSSRFDVVRTGDGLFGAVWSDARTGTQQVWIDVFDNSGRMGFAPSGGLQLSSGAGPNVWPAIATNAYRDFLVTWVSNNQVFGARRQQDLSVHPAFAAGSAVIANTVSSYMHHPSIASDGGEGLLVGWRDPGEYSVLRAQRMTGSGTVPAGWGPGGQVMATSTGSISDYTFIFSDGDQGASAAFSDYGALAINRLRRDGTHGLLAPAVFASIADVPMDQGGRLAVNWRASEVDTTPANSVGSYMLWRRMPAFAAQARLGAGTPAFAEGTAPEAAAPGAIRALSGPGTTTYWEYLGSTPARGWAGYGRSVDTNSDAYFPWGYVPYEVFFVETVSPTGVVLATSAPDSGFSIDNLSPALPTSFMAARVNGVTYLMWDRCNEPDFHTYRLHRGTYAGFVPNDANLVAALTDPYFADGGSAGWYYKVAATDVHGNSSGFALVSPSQTLDAPGAEAATLSFAPVSPNPARGRVSFAFSLPAAGAAKLAIFDAQGRLARTVLDGALPAGPHSRTWDLRDGAGRALAPGLYLARLTTPAGTLVRRFAVVE